MQTTKHAESYEKGQDGKKRANRKRASSMVRVGVKVRVAPQKKTIP